MIRECKCCGAPADQQGLQAWWECKFCRSINYDERVVEAYLASTDIAKLSNQIRIGRSYYEAGDFQKAVDHFDRALVEDAGHAKAWAYKGLALAYTIDLQNTENVLRGVEQCFKQARSANSEGDDLVDAAHGVARERVVAELLRCAVRETEHAEKSIFAFSDDPGTRAVYMQEDSTPVRFPHWLVLVSTLVQRPPDGRRLPPSHSDLQRKIRSARGERRGDRSEIPG